MSQEQNVTVPCQTWGNVLEKYITEQNYFCQNYMCKKDIMVTLYCSGLAVGNDTWCKLSTLCGVGESYVGEYIECCPLGSDIVQFGGQVLCSGGKFCLPLQGRRDKCYYFCLYNTVHVPGFVRGTTSVLELGEMFPT